MTDFSGTTPPESPKKQPFFADPNRKEKHTPGTVTQYPAPRPPDISPPPPGVTYPPPKPPVTLSGGGGGLSPQDQTKLNSIEPGAEVNVQSDWTQADPSDDSFIRNKPDLSMVGGGGGVLTDDAVLDLAKPTRNTSDRGRFLGTSDTNQNDLVLLDPIQGPPGRDGADGRPGRDSTVPGPQGPRGPAGSDATVTDDSVLDLAKSSRNSSDRGKFLGTSTFNQNDLVLLDAPSGGGTGLTPAQLSKLNSIATGAEVNVQSDWSVTNTSSDAYIRNKPTPLQGPQGPQGPKGDPPISFTVVSTSGSSNSNRRITRFRIGSVTYNV